MLGAVLNIVLDPLFIFGFDMGVQGGALATVLSQLGSCIFVLAFLFSRRVPVRIHFGGYRFSIMRQVLKIGFTPFIIIAVDSVMTVSYTHLPFYSPKPDSIKDTACCKASFSSDPMH